MKRIFMGMLALSAFVITASAQQPYESKIEYNKTEQPALVMEYNFPQDVVETAIKDKMASMGLKGKSSKGFITYSAATVSEISSTPMDYAFKIDRKSRKEKGVTVVYMVMGGANAMSSDNAGASSNGKYFLSNLAPNVQAGSLELEIKAQEEVLTKNEKKLKSLQDDKSSMEKKVSNLQDDLKKNEKDQENQSKELDKQRSILDALKQRRQ